MNYENNPKEDYMSKRLIKIIPLMILLFSTLTGWAATEINLNSPINATLQTTTTVLPTLSWTIVGTAPDHYKLEISLSPDLSSPVINVNPAISGNDLNISNVLKYNTIYYWRIYQLNSDQSSFGEPSAIATFTTPKMSVLPYIKWSNVGLSGNYTITISKNSNLTNPIYSINTGSTNNFYKLLNTQPLEYNTTYYYKVSRNGGQSEVESFTTKPLNIISESYEYSINGGITWSSLNPSTIIIPDETPGLENKIKLTILTDEFENMNGVIPSNSKVTISAISSISNSTRSPIGLQISTPIGLNSEITTTFNLINAGTLVIPSSSQIALTNNETLALKFLYGNSLLLNTNIPSQVTITSTLIYEDADGGSQIGTSSADIDNNGLFVRFVTAGNPNNHENIIIKNMSNGNMIYRYAYSTGNNYLYHITSTELNQLTDNSIPQRISVYSVTDNLAIKDFIWLADGAMPANASDVSFSVISAIAGSSVNVTINNANYTRIISSLDPVGIIINKPGSAPVSINLGTETSQLTKTISVESGGWVEARSYDGLILYNTLTVSQDTYSAFNMLTPSNFSSNMDIYPKFTWERAYGTTRGTNDITRYEFSISEASDFSGPTTKTYITTLNEYYPQEDLEYGKSYFWKVRVLPVGPNGTPANIGTMGAWVLTTTPRPAGSEGLLITTTIPQNRTLVLENSPYYLSLNPASANNTSLTIEPGVELRFYANTKLVIGGNLVMNGTTLNPIVLTSKTNDPLTLWSGIEIKNDASISRQALLVNPDKTYLSGNIINHVTIKYSLKPISYQQNSVFDFYISNCSFIHNETGIDISAGSYVVDSQFNTFDVSGATPQTSKYAIKGGTYFSNLTIQGQSNISRFNGLGIQTSTKNAMFMNLTIKYLNSNAIECNSSALDGGIFVNNCTIQNNSGIAIKAIKGSIITNNVIGGYNTSDPLPSNHYSMGNSGSAIQNGVYIANNLIERNGANSILSDNGATVINNEILNNPGYGILNGKSISNNTIINDVAISASLQCANAIKADDEATVSNNIIQNNKGFGIQGGKIIYNNLIEITDPNLTGSLTAAFAIQAKANVSDSRIENNVITNPIGFAIQYGKTIINNTITKGNNTLPSGSFGIQADAEAIVKNNIITGMTGTAIEKGMIIHNNTLINIKGDLIKADNLGIVTNNTMTFSNPDLVTGYAIQNGRVINFNTIKGIKSGVADLISSAYLEEFKNNSIGGTGVFDYNTASSAGGSILSSVKTVTTPLVISNNTFFYNRYNNNVLKVQSNNLTISNNNIMNTYGQDVDFPGGLMNPPTTAGAGSVINIKLTDAVALMTNNIITGHKGYKDGATLYIEATSPSTNKITITDNILTNNHALSTEAKGAALYHKTGIVILDYNTITNNSTPNNPNPSGSAIYTEPTGTASPTANGYLEIKNNIIASNKGNWAILGAPKLMSFNNIYDNTSNGEEENWPDNPGLNLYYNFSAPFVNATNNFWGNRSDLGQIDPSIYDDNESTYGAVTYQPILSGPSITTPGTVNGLQTILVTNTNATNDLASVLGIPTNIEVFATVTATDNNPYSQDYTEVIIQNLSTGQFIRPLLQETSSNSEVYKASFTLVTDASGYNPETNQLPVTGGDLIYMYSVYNTSLASNLIANMTGFVTVTPYINEFNFLGVSTNSGSRQKVFTFTNNGETPLTINTITLTGINAADYSFVNKPVNNTILNVEASFEVVVAFSPTADGDRISSLNIDFVEDNENDRVILLNGQGISNWVGYNPFSSPNPQTNQMTIISNIQYLTNGASQFANPGDYVAAYVVKGLVEDLRGVAQITGPSGLTTILVQSSIANEPVTFKIWNSVNHTLFESDYTTMTVLGGTIGGNSRSPVTISGKSVYLVSGNVTKSTGGALTDVTLTNTHASAPVDPITNSAYHYITDINGDYSLSVYDSQDITLVPEKQGYSFSPVMINIPAISANNLNQDFVGTIQTYLVSGSLTVGNGSLGLSGIDVYNGHLTDQNGNYFFRVDAGTNVVLTVSQVELNAAGYLDIQLSQTISVDLGQIQHDLIDTDATNITENDGLLRTQVINLTTGWNLISLNVIPAVNTPNIVFAFPADANGGLSADVLQEIRISTQVYSPGAQGISTLTEIMPGYGYYVKVSGNATLTIIGNPANQSETISLDPGWNLTGYPLYFSGQPRFLLNNNSNIEQVNSLTQAYFYQDEPVGISTLTQFNSGMGYWFKVNESLDDAIDLIYSNNNGNIINSFSFRRSDNNGAPNQAITSLTDVKGVIDNNHLGSISDPKVISMTFSSGQTIGQFSASVDFNTSVFSPALVKAYNLAQYSTLVSLPPQDQRSYILANGTNLTVLANGSFGYLNNQNSYIIFADNDLLTGNNPYRTRLLCYQISTINSVLNTDKVLTGFDITTGGQTYYAMINETANPKRGFIKVPNGSNLTNIPTHFSVNGYGLFDAAGITGVQMTSGTNQTYTANAIFSFYVEDLDGANDGSDADRQEYQITVVTETIRANENYARRNKNIIANSNNSINSSKIEDPFGKVKTLPNSHLVWGKISLNGAPVNSNTIIAAYVNNELRGKQQVITFETQTYLPIIINTINENEVITFKMWKPNDVVKTFNQTLNSLPGGTTGNYNNFYSFNAASVDNNDTSDIIFINELKNAYPNPFNPITTISFSIKDKSFTALEIYNIKGQKVKTLKKAVLDKGNYHIQWDGKNDQGHKAGSGIYFYRLSTKDYLKIKKVILLK